MESVTKKETIHIAYVVELSTKTQIKIDPEELDSVLRGVSVGNLIRVKSGIINPSFIVAITEDVQRKVEFLERTKYEPTIRAGGMKPIADIFPMLRSFKTLDQAKELHALK